MSKIIKKRKDAFVFDILKTKYKVPNRFINDLKEVHPINIHKDDINKNLFIYGKTGTGKTLYSLSLAFQILKNIKVPIMQDTLAFVIVSDLLMDLKQYYKKSQINPNFGMVTNDEDGIVTTFEERIMNKCKQARLLIFDDFGVSKSTDWTNDIMYSIINYRYNNYSDCNNSKFYTTIITSNLTKEELSNKMDDRVISRISDMCNSLLFKTQYRKT